jgi:hypothetical protein
MLFAKHLISSQMAVVGNQFSNQIPNSAVSWPDIKFIATHDHSFSHTPALDRFNQRGGLNVDLLSRSPNK